MRHVALARATMIHALLTGARAHAFHDAGRRAEARRRAGERLRWIIGGLPQALCPASYSGEGFTKTFGAEPAGGWYAAPEALPFQTRDRKAELLAHHCRRRRFQLLVRFFEALRRGQASTRGQLPNGSQLLLMPPERRDGQTTLAKHGKAVAAERTWSPGEFLRGNTAYGCCS